MKRSASQPPPLATRSTSPTATTATRRRSPTRGRTRGPLDKLPELGRTEAVRGLDVARIEALVVQYILSAGTATPSLAYTADAHAAFEAVRNGRAAAAVLLNPTRVEQVFAVADAGGVM